MALNCRDRALFLIIILYYINAFVGEHTKVYFKSLHVFLYYYHGNQFVAEQILALS